MKRLLRTVKLATMTTALTLLCASVAQAGQWEQDARGYRWKYDNGGYPLNAWCWIDGNQDGIFEYYYFDENRYMLANTTAPDGNKVNENGAWVLNGVIQTQNSQENALYEEAEEAYRDYMDALDESEDVRYNLVYLDDDAIPELMYATGSYHAAGVHICTYRDGKVYPLSSYAHGSYGELTYLPKTGLIWTADMHMGYEYEGIYRMQNMQLQEVCYASYNADTENGEGTEYDEFRLNGQTSTKETVLNYAEQLTGESDQAEFFYDQGYEYHGERM